MDIRRLCGTLREALAQRHSEWSRLHRHRPRSVVSAAFTTASTSRVVKSPRTARVRTTGYPLGIRIGPSGLQASGLRDLPRLCQLRDQSHSEHKHRFGGGVEARSAVFRERFVTFDITQYHDRTVPELSQLRRAARQGQQLFRFARAPRRPEQLHVRPDAMQDYRTPTDSIDEKKVRSQVEFREATPG